MKLFNLFILASLICSTKTLAQRDTTLYVDEAAYESINDKKTSRELEMSLKAFLIAKNAGSRNNPYINPAYLKLDIEPFPWLLNFEVSLPNGENFYKPTLLKVMPIENGQFIIKLAYMGISKHVPPRPFLNRVTTLIAKKEGEHYFFYNTLEYNTRKWQKIRIGRINYIYPVNIDIKRARTMDMFNTTFAKKFETKPLEVTYYKCENLEQLFKIMGYDYIENMYYSETGGLAQAWNSTILAGNNSELYEHELVHFYTAKLFPNIGKIANEGYATYIGGSGGKSLKQLVPAARAFILNNPNIDIVSLGTDFSIRVEGDTMITYILSAVICRDIENRFGLEGLKHFFSPVLGENYFITLERITGVNKTTYPTYIKRLLAEYNEAAH